MKTIEITTDAKHGNIEGFIDTDGNPINYNSPAVFKGEATPKIFESEDAAEQFLKEIFGDGLEGVRYHQIVEAK